ncbi:hypothetical protein A9W98_18045 [Mycobacterium gordonae]|uniref:Uncharacterized protein n=1 Tax=Mycobacterium gordonae TaxID=1778 RepID=A0A1A6BI30_MYCGO|nr:hypothetical protein [Mycobacterium gordonae]OBS01884.1 hypothetical protein A9W98_18045 [Mycobacterium gordonae]
MKRTEAQALADDHFEAALKEVLRAYGRIPDDATLVSFTGVFEAMRFEAETGFEYEHHGLIHMGGTERRSVVKGLLTIGLERINDECRCGDDDG